MNEHQTYYTLLPAKVRYNNELKASEKIFYSEIVGLCNEQGFCTTTNAYFAKLYNVSKATISQYISSLQKEGFIISKIDKDNANSRKIYICDLFPRQVTGI